MIVFGIDLLDIYNYFNQERNLYMIWINGVLSQMNQFMEIIGL